VSYIMVHRFNEDWRSRTLNHLAQRASLHKRLDLTFRPMVLNICLSCTHFRIKNAIREFGRSAKELVLPLFTLALRPSQAMSASGRL
jgi:hypothetical protein